MRQAVQETALISVLVLFMKTVHVTMITSSQMFIVESCSMQDGPTAGHIALLTPDSQ